jgi:hypothetical protein
MKAPRFSPCDYNLIRLQPTQAEVIGSIVTFYNEQFTELQANPKYQGLAQEAIDYCQQFANFTNYSLDYIFESNRMRRKAVGLEQAVSYLVGIYLSNFKHFRTAP